MTMLEKAARAGDEALFKEHGVMLGRETSRTFVIAVLRAIREPSDDTIYAGMGDEPFDLPIQTTWPRMIDAILAEQGEGKT